jgi:hypothetical protein
MKTLTINMNIGTGTANYNCRVCGLTQLDPPWGEDGNTPLFEFCPCCGVEFGYQDNTVESTRAFRERWLSRGALWDMPEKKALNWKLEKQLAQIPTGYL